MFLLLSIYWSYTDPRGIKERYVSYLKSKRLFFNIIAAALLITFTSLTLNFRVPISYLDPILATIGIIITHLGVVLAVWAKIVMGKSWGPPAYSNSHHQIRLITTGPFRYTRNPIYLGLFLMFCGMSISFSSYSIFLMGLIYLGVKKIVVIEEKKLKKQYGDEYAKYCEKVPRFL